MNGGRMLAALCFALLSSGLFTWQLGRHIARPQPVEPACGAVVAAKNLAAGEALTPASFAVVKLPASSVTTMKLFSETESLKGRVLLTPVFAGEPITAHELAPAGVSAGLAATIPTGMRVIAVPVSNLVTGNANLIAPGNRVDVLVSYHSEDAAGFVSSMVLESVPVVGDAHMSVEGTEKPNLTESVNLLVTPEQAARLTIASSLGKLTFALRNGMDQGLSQGLARVALTSLMRPKATVVAALRPQHVAAAPPSKSAFAVEMLSEGKSFTKSFPEDHP